MSQSINHKKAEHWCQHQKQSELIVQEDLQPLKLQGILRDNMNGTPVKSPKVSQPNTRTKIADLTLKRFEIQLILFFQGINLLTFRVFKTQKPYKEGQEEMFPIPQIIMNNLAQFFSNKFQEQQNQIKQQNIFTLCQGIIVLHSVAIYYRII
ncbi:hypothetical protein pb186bvf_015254 [Paramecium bursaria]